MEITSSSPSPQRRHHHQEVMDHIPSPTTTTSPGSCSSSSSTTITNAQTPPLTPNPDIICRSQHHHDQTNNPYPTTFVQADTSSFKQVVQMLTGSPKPDPSRCTTTTTTTNNNITIPPIRSTGQKRPGFKLYERRNSLKNGLMINTLAPHNHHHHQAGSSGFSPRCKPPEMLSPSILDFPSLVLSPVTPMNEDTLSRSSVLEEEKAIADKKFYLHPSPRTTTPRNAEPQLLPLFPVTSPRLSGPSS